jgi:hypothetical protein
MLVKILASATLGLAVFATGCGFAIHLAGANDGNPRPHIVLGCSLLGLILATTVAVWVKG